MSHILSSRDFYLTSVLYEFLLCDLSLSVHSRGWCWFRGPGQWYELLPGEPLLHLQWSADRVHTVTSQWTAVFFPPPTPPPAPSPSSPPHPAQPAETQPPIGRAEPRLPRAALLLVCGLPPDWPPTVAAHAHPRCQVVVRPKQLLMNFCFSKQYLGCVTNTGKNGSKP